MRELPIPEYEEFWGQARNIYKVWDDLYNTYATGGYYRQNSLFNFLTVPKAGHFVPNWTNNYKPSLQFLNDMMNNNG